ncbi:MAG: hypothetical protein K2K93_04235 [Muribaculaceae bacterium]|nr:hypothetical protein [Muribaculaceae bacterium]
MEYLDFGTDLVSCRVSLFHGNRGEAHAVITPAPGHGSPLSEIEAVSGAAADVAARLGMQPVFMRWMLSDVTNQAGLIPDGPACARSIIQQSPLCGSRASLLLMLEQDPGLVEIGPGIWKDNHGRIRMGDDDTVECADSATMTRRYLLNLDNALRKEGGSLADNCLRTWFFVRDIDNNYAGLVQARNEVFAGIGLTPETHFIASTGIAGQSRQPQRLVAFNAFADLGVESRQIRYLTAKSHLSPTYDYGVAFERGTAVDYADRRHVYISGTASINNRGEIVCPGDIAGQTERMLENIGMLLEEAGCGAEDLAHLIVYLRDIADFHTVSDIFSRRFPHVPAAIVLAPVCRPGWLVETECMAIKGISLPEYDAY